MLLELLVYTRHLATLSGDNTVVAISLSIFSMFATRLSCCICTTKPLQFRLPEVPISVLCILYYGFHSWIYDHIFQVLYNNNSQSKTRLFCCFSVTVLKFRQNRCSCFGEIFYCFEGFAKSRPQKNEPPICIE